MLDSGLRHFVVLRYDHDMPFGEIVLGPPGSGKSTYCYAKHQLFEALGRPIAVVNLDPANDNIPYPCAVNISEIITLRDVMNQRDERGFGLGPNGGMLFCMEYLEENFDWLVQRLDDIQKAHGQKGRDGEVYVLFDVPGQVELSTNHESLQRILRRLEKTGYRVSHSYIFRRGHLRRTVGSCSSERFSLHHGSGQVHCRGASVITGDATTRVASYQRPLKNRSPCIVRPIGFQFGFLYRSSGPHIPGKRIVTTHATEIQSSEPSTHRPYSRPVTSGVRDAGSGEQGLYASSHAGRG